MRGRQLSEACIARLADHPERCFPDKAAWSAHLATLAIPARARHPDPARIASEGALWGGLVARGFAETVILSDDAGQFALGRHALCWVHAERLVYKLDTFCARQTRAKEAVRAGLWDLYRAFKAYCRDPVPSVAATLRARFDRLVATRTGFATLDRLLARLAANRDELLLALDRPEVPLHTNDAENDLRAVVTRRKLSGGTRSGAGRACRDAFLGLVKTCAKLGIRFWDYLGARLQVPGTPAIPHLDQLVRHTAPT
ncbi:MAG TPA: transposase [Pilimelia sp.]|nr:transposase [Pilimelia sp.]